MTKKVLSLILAAAMSVMLVTGVAAEAGLLSRGDGTVDSPYEIADFAQLQQFAEEVNEGNGAICAVLTRDIDADENEAEKWTPIGSEDMPFSGTFDGRGHTVRGLNSDNPENPDADSSGFFAYIGDGGTVRNLAVLDCEFSALLYVGGICGYNAGTIENCLVVDCDAESEGFMGSLCGYNVGAISRCLILEDENEVCGIDSGTIDNCFKSAELDSEGLRSGEAAWLLQGDQNAQTWGQELGVDEFPRLTGELELRVCKVEICQSNDGETETRYINGGTPELETPEREGFVFDGWYTDEALTEAFDGKLLGDTRLYAKWMEDDVSPEPTVTSTPTSAPGPTPSGSPAPTSEPTPSSSPTPSSEPTPSGSPAPTSEPTHSNNPEPTSEPTPTSNPVPTPIIPVGVPELPPTTSEPEPSPEPTPELPPDRTFITVDGSGNVNVDLGPDSPAVLEGETVKLPELSVSEDEYAPTVSVHVPDGSQVRLKIPVEPCGKGLVAVAVRDDGVEELVKLSYVTGNSMTLAVEGNVTIKLLDRSIPFGDVKEGDWYSGAVDYVSARGLLQGTDDGCFSPENELNRAMMATVLFRMADRPQASDGAFSDTAADVWYASPLAWATARGITDGSEPERGITRQELAVMLWRYAGCPAGTGTLDGFTDRSEADSWATDALRWAVEHQLIQGKGGGILDPQGAAIRAEAATVIERFIAMLVMSNFVVK